MDFPVGLRNRTTPVTSKKADQRILAALFAKIKPADGGKPSLVTGEDGKCPKALADAIWNFQMLWKQRGVVKVADGVVEPNRTTWNKLVELANAGAAPGPWIAFRQTNPVAASQRRTPVISPVQFGSKLAETVVSPRIHDLLFEMKKDSTTFWVGASVPEGTVDFTKVQVFFHPTVTNGGIVHAEDADYAAFKGGWSASIQRYVAMEGAQLAAARMVTMIVPFTTMGGPNMFQTRPIDTLNEIMGAIQGAVQGRPTAAASVTQVGVTSFIVRASERGRSL